MNCDRRNFLKTLAGSVGAGVFGRDLFALPGTNVTFSAGSRAAPAGRIVVFVQLDGGNDGLNTVYPLNGVQRTNYTKFRETLAMPSSAGGLQPWVTAGIGTSGILDIGTNADGCRYAFNPAMAALHSLYQTGKVAVIPGVHYPNANHSHFESSNIYTSGDPSGSSSFGWFGKYLDAAGYTPTDLPGIIMNNSVTPMFSPTSASLFAFSRLNQLRFPSTDKSDSESMRYQMLCNFAKMRDSGLVPELVKIAETGAATVGHMQDFYNRPARGEPKVPAKVQALLSDENGNYQFGNPLIYDSPLNSEQNPKIEGSGLANDLRHVAAIIRANVGASFFHVSIGGFDSHSEQENDLYHSRLLHEVSEAIAAFYNEMSHAVTLPGTLTGYETGSLADNVVIMTFSEFGRTIRQNAMNVNNAGTDHATSAPQFIIGGKVIGKQYGDYPQLDDPGAEAEDDLKMTTDFRDVFGTIMNRWLSVPLDTLGPGPGKLLTPTVEPDGDGKDYTTFTPMGFLAP